MCCVMQGTTHNLCDNLEQWDGCEGGPRGDLRLIHADARHKPIQPCKTITLQLK